MSPGRGRSRPAIRVSWKDPWTIIIYHSPAVAGRTTTAKCLAPRGFTARSSGRHGRRAAVAAQPLRAADLGPGPAVSLPARADPRLPGEHRRGRQYAADPARARRLLQVAQAGAEFIRTTGCMARGRSKSCSRRFCTRLRIISSTPSPQTFGSRGCRRAYGLMHSRLFWRIFGELKWRWANRAAVRSAPLVSRYGPRVAVNRPGPALSPFRPRRCRPCRP